MGHSVSAFVADRQTLKKLSHAMGGADIFRLHSEDYLLLPVTDDAFDKVVSLKGSSDPLSADFWGLSQTLAQLAGAASSAGPLAYIETDYFGGSGTQSAIVWKDGAIIGEPPFIRIGAINHALATLGLGAKPPLDAFDTLGLGEVRSTADFAERTPEK